MIKFVFVLFASALLVEGLPGIPPEFTEKLKNDNWEDFRKLLNFDSFGVGWPAALSGSVESLQPSDGTHVYGHSLSSFKEWRNDNGNIFQDGKGVEVENVDGQVSKRKFQL